MRFTAGLSVASTTIVIMTITGCPQQGVEGGPCYGNGSCDEGLVCLSDLCVIDEGSTPDAGDPEPEPEPDPDGGGPGPSSATAVITAEEGGELSVGGATLVVPAGAVTSPVEITVTATGEAPPSGYDGYSNVWRFEPSGTTFATPATLRLAFVPGTTPPSIFWSADAGGFEALPTVVEGNAAVGSVTHFSSGFVAGNQGCVATCPGTSWGDDDGCGFSCACAPGFDPQADGTCLERNVSCLDIDRGDVQVHPQAGLRVSFRIRDCTPGQEGAPVRRLELVEEGGGDIVRVINLETGQDFNASAEGGSRSALARPSNFGLFTMVALDMSDSIVNGGDGVAAEVINAARAFVQHTVENQPTPLRSHVAIMIFGSTAQTQVVQDFTQNAAALYTQLDLLEATFAGPASTGLGSTNLYGAYTTAIDEVMAQGDAFELVERGVLLLTDGLHEAGGATELRPAALAAKDAAVMDGGLNAFSVFVSDASCATAPSELAELATSSSYFFCTEDEALLNETFTGIANQIAGIADSNYAVGVCTPVELGTPYLRVEVELDSGATGELELSYPTTELTGNLASCNAEDLAYPCADLECGAGLVDGVICGSCISEAYCSATQQCEARTICGAGERVAGAPVEDQDTLCVACQAGTYQPDEGATECPLCPAGTWDDDADPTTACVPHTICAPEEYTHQVGSNVQDYVCSLCPLGTWDHDDDEGTFCENEVCDVYPEGAGHSTCRVVNQATLEDATATQFRDDLPLVQEVRTLVINCVTSSVGYFPEDVSVESFQMSGPCTDLVGGDGVALSDSLNVRDTLLTTLPALNLSGTDSIYIRDNTQLTSLNTAVIRGNGLQVFDNEQLDLSGITFHRPDPAFANSTLSNNAPATSIHVVFEGSGHLDIAQPLGALTVSGAGPVLLTTEGVESIAAPDLTAGALTIGAGASAISFPLFDDASVVLDGTSLTSLTGLGGLTLLGQGSSLTVANNAVLENLSGLGPLRSGSVLVENNPALNSLGALQTMNDPDNDHPTEFSFVNNPALPACLVDEFCAGRESCVQSGSNTSFVCD